MISTAAGSGEDGFAGDGGPATAAALSMPSSCCVDRRGHLFIIDNNNLRVRRVDADSGVIKAVGVKAILAPPCVFHSRFSA